MIKGALSYLKEQFKIQEPVIVHNDKSYIHSGDSLKALLESVPEQLQFGTLDALLEWGKKRSMEVVDEGYSPYYIVDRFNAVRLISPVFGEHYQRRMLAIASVKMDEMDDRHHKYSTEDLIIDLQTHFENTPNLVKLIKLLSNVTKDSGVTQSDNGIGQDVVVKDGVAFKTKATVPNPIELKPYCTFAEIDIPARKYIFRVDNALNWKLIKVNDPAWEYKVKEIIGKYLKKSVGKLEVYV